jgi:hypothetical protein
VRSELLFYFINGAILTVVVSLFVLWRYRVAVLKGMMRGESEELPLPDMQPRKDKARGTSVREMLLWEKRREREIALAYLFSTLICALPLSATALYLAGIIPVSPTQLIKIAAVYAFACAPMIATSLALSPLRLLVAMALLTTILAVLPSAFFFVEHAVRVGKVGWPLYTPLDTLDLVRSQLWLIALLSLIAWPRRLRGVAPTTFAALLLFGLGQFISARLNKTMYPNMYSGGFNLTFALIALPAAWLAWASLSEVARRYEHKRFSDAQLLSRTWWTILVVNVGLQIGSEGPWLSAATDAVALIAFPPLSARLLARGQTMAGTLHGRNLLVLRVFGHTGRTERLFDRIGARWRLFGPITMISAPDVAARIINPGDYLRWLTGRLDELFVTSRTDLTSKLAALDMEPDPDGRYRVNAFCCRTNTWQATVVELMYRADAVVMDVRGITRERHGIEFELRQLNHRLRVDQLVLVTDGKTDRSVLEEAFGTQMTGVRVVEVRGSRNTDAVFTALLEAAA